MVVFFSTFQGMATLFVIGILGFYIIKKNLVPTSVLGTISPLVLEVSLPAVVFVKIITGLSPQSYFEWLIPSYYWLVFTLIALVLSVSAGFLAKRENRGEFVMSLFFQNAIFIPMVILSELNKVDKQILVDLFLFTMLYPAIAFNTYYLFFNKKDSINWKRILHPVLISTMLAVTIKLSGGDRLIPQFVIKGLSLIGNMTIPLLMIMVGGNIYIDFLKKGPIQVGEVVKFILFKNIIFPMVALAILFFVQLKTEIATIILLQAAVPPLMAVPVFAQRAQGNSSLVNQFVVASSLFSIVSIPLILAIFNRYISTF